jgi:hypothetical protein
MKRVRVEGPVKNEVIDSVLDIKVVYGAVVIVTDHETIIHSNGQHRYVYIVEEQ